MLKKYRYTGICRYFEGDIPVFGIRSIDSLYVTGILLVCTRMLV